MKKSIKLISTVLAVLIMTLSVVSVCAVTKPRVNFTVLGDSIASGYGLSKISDSYGSIIANQKNYTLKNSAVPGHTTSNLKSLLTSNSTVKNNVSSADVIVVSIGGNDILGVLYNATTNQLIDIMFNGANAAVLKSILASLETNLTDICNSIRKLNPNATIIFQTIYNSFYANPDFSQYASTLDKISPVFNQLYSTVAAKYSNIYVADIYTAFDNYYKAENNYNVIQSDGIHPSVKGHKLIADTILDIIDKLEKQDVVPVVGTEPAFTYLLGDADKSDKVTISDATTIQKYAADIIVFDSETTLCADADMDGDVNVKDATAIQKYLAFILTDTLIGTYITL